MARYDKPAVAQIKTFSTTGKQDLTLPVNYISNNSINFKDRKLPFSCLHTLQKVR